MPRKKIDPAPMRNALMDRNLVKVSDATGLHYNTLLQFRLGNRNPHQSTLKVLADYFNAD